MQRIMFGGLGVGAAWESVVETKAKIARSSGAFMENFGRLLGGGGRCGGWRVWGGGFGLGGIFSWGAAWERAPDIFHEGKYFGFGLFEFSGDEWIEVIGAEVTFGHFGEEFLGVGYSIMFAGVAWAGEDTLVFSAITKLFPGGFHPWLIKPEDLIVVSVSEFVEDHPGHPMIFEWGKKVFRDRNMHALD